jgi:polyhydroxyalkanoate synthesis regulator phasin
MSQKSENSNPFDPTGMFKNMRDTGMEAWSKMMIQLVNSEAYAQASGTMLDAWLTGSAPFRKAIESTMTQVLTQLNMPIRTDITSLAERLTHIEMRLDDLEAKLDERSRPAPKAAPGKTKETAA